jgi:hypothetical protein
MNSTSNIIKILNLKSKMAFGRLLREAGLQLDRQGSNLTYDISYLQPLSRHRQLTSIDCFKPSIPS